MDEARLKYLFEKYLRRNCTPAEETELMQLLSDSGLELEKALLIEQLYDRTPDDADMPESSATRILQTILGSQSNGVSAPAAEPLRDRVNLRSWLKVAAALVPLFLLGAYLWLNPGKGGGMADRAPEPAESMEKILPGGNRALLTLADGSVIVLDEAGEGELASQAGSNIVKRENGLIVYYPGGDGGAVESERATLQYNTIQTPKGGEYAVVLPDGSKVWLNALSSLRFPARFGDRERRVEVTGEAYFEIARVKNADGGNLPFFVAFKTASGKDAAIEVLGTRFNLNAYPDEQAVKATLIEGSVRIGMDGTLQTLKPGQQSNINANDVMTVVDGVDLFEAIAWKNGFFHFENADLKTVMRQLQRWYDVEVVFEGALNDTETFSGEIGRDLELSQVVKLLRQMDLNIRIENRKMMVSP